MAAYNFNEMSQNVQPNGYHVRLTLFVTAPLNAKIRLGETENHTHLDFGKCCSRVFFAGCKIR